jgi:hypothetical protein
MRRQKSKSDTIEQYKPEHHHAAAASIARAIPDSGAHGSAAHSGGSADDFVHHIAIEVSLARRWSP